jgi:hypothetical protein
MHLTRILGLVMIILSLSLLFLVIAKFPNVKNKSFSIENPLEVPHGANNLFNITLQPSGKNDYHVEVLISPTKGPICIDFWVVNSTWIGPFLSFMEWVFFEYGTPFREAYPDEYPFNITPAYAKEINVTKQKLIELKVDRDGVYCFVFINFFEEAQYISVNVDERYLDPKAPYRPILEPNLTNLSITFAVASFGAYFLVKDQGKRRRRKW